MPCIFCRSVGCVEEGGKGAKQITLNVSYNDIPGIWSYERYERNELPPLSK
jgi:hypothetical protein